MGKLGSVKAFVHLSDPDAAEITEVTSANPMPVKVMEDVQTRNIHGRTFQVAPVTTAAGTLIAEANSKRRSITIINLTGTQDAFIGYVSVPLATNGALLLATKGSNLTLYAKDAIWGLSMVAAQTLTVIEENYVDA